MKKDDMLDKYVTYGIHGVPEIKKDEKRKYLGQFRERIIKVITLEQIESKYGIYVLNRVLEENECDKVIINQLINNKIQREVMKEISNYKLEFTVVNSEEYSKDIGIILVKDFAVNKDDIYVKFDTIPEEYLKKWGSKICQDCMNKIIEKDKKIAKEFKTLTLIDKISGLKCSICKKK